ncbi:MAG: NAD(P)-binding protein [Chlorobi bacterium]|nr:NAD(P)-binding protein [Chlorobiota bacterium]
MISRRDVLRILLLGSGALYTAPLLGSCQQDRTPRRVSNEHSAKNTYPHVAHQYYDAPHQYIREHRHNTLSWQSAHHHTTDVAIIGAGPAGLAAAVALLGTNYDFVLLDNESVGGGAARCGRYDSVEYPLAAVYFVERTAPIEELCRFAGVQPIEAPGDTLILDRNPYQRLWQDETIATLPICATEKSELRRFRDDLLDRIAQGEIPSYPLPETLPPHLQTLDSTSAASFVAQYRSPLLHTILELYTRSSMGGSLESVNAYALLNFYASEIATPRYTFPGGLAGVTVPVVKKLGDRVQTGMTCLRIENPANPLVWALDREGRLHRIQSRVAIVTVQKFMIPWVIPDLPAAQQAAMHSLQYAPFLTVHLCAHTPLLPSGFDIWIPEGSQLFTDIINANAMMKSTVTSAAVASIYAPRTVAERAIMQSDDILAAYAQRIAERAVQSVPTIPPEAIEEVHVFGWGHAVVMPVPGSHSVVAQQARQRYENILFANTDNDSAPAFENAVAHGYRAAEDAIELLS